MNSFLALALSWVMATNGVAVNLDHAAAVKVVKVNSTVAGEVYRVQTVPAVGTISYTLAVFLSPEEAAEYVENLQQKQAD